MTIHIPLKLENLPQTFPEEEFARLELVEGIPIIRASQKVQERINTLLSQYQQFTLSLEEEQELNDYEELDDYLSLVNRTIRNFYINKK